MLIDTSDARFTADVLEPPDLLGQGRLGDVDRLRGAAEVAVMRHRDEVLELPELHGRRLSLDPPMIRG